MQQSKHQTSRRRDGVIDATVAEEDYDVESGGKRVALPGETFNNPRRQRDSASACVITNGRAFAV